jgi:hypothetical protein
VQGCIFGAKYTHICDEVERVLPAGTYYLRVRMLWAGTERAAVLAPYACEKIVLSEVGVEEGRQAWAAAAAGETAKEAGKPLQEGLQLHMKW